MIWYVGMELLAGGNGGHHFLPRYWLCPETVFHLILDPAMFPNTLLCWHGRSLFVIEQRHSVFDMCTHKPASHVDWMLTAFQACASLKSSVCRNSINVPIRLGIGCCQPMIITSGRCYPVKLLVLKHNGTNSATKRTTRRQWHCHCLFLVKRVVGQKMHDVIHTSLLRMRHILEDRKQVTINWRCGLAAL